MDNTNYLTKYMLIIIIILLVIYIYNYMNCNKLIKNNI
jgi:hypothetical protein